jgi:hypothetical protein
LDRTIARSTSVCRAFAESGWRTGFHSVGACGNPGEDSGLGEVELGRRDVEVALRGGLDAVRLGAVKALVEVELHDLVFAVGLAQLVGERDLFDLSAVGLVRRQELLASQLLGDRASTSDDPAGAKVVERGADDASQVEARVGVEALVLDRDRGLDRDRRDVLQLDGEAVVAMVADVGQHDLAGAVVDDRVARESGRVEALDRGQALEERLRVGVGREADHEEHRDRGAQATQQRRPAHLLPDRRPRGVYPRSRAVSPLRLDPLRNVSSHALEGRERF